MDKKNIQGSLPIDCDFSFVCLLLPEIFSKIINITGNNFSIFSYGIIFLVQLWTVNNYHWYLKQQLEFPASLKDRVACFTWDPEVSLRMHLMTKGKSYIKSINLLKTHFHPTGCTSTSCFCFEVLASLNVAIRLLVGSLVCSHNVETSCSLSYIG